MSTAMVDDPLRQRHSTGLRLTREGWLCLGVAAMLLTIGIGKNINLLTLLAYVLLALIVLGSVVVGRRFGRLEARRVLDENVFAGVPVHCEVRLHNTSSRQLQGVRIEEVGSIHAVGWYFDRLEGHARVSLSSELVLPHRGWYDFAPLAAVSSHPFGLWRRRTLIGLPLRVLVLPQLGKIVRERLRQQLRGADPHGERVHRHGWRHDAAQADFHGLRPFRPGDSPLWIHWRTTARRGELMVREFEDVPGDDLVVVVDPRAWGQDLEAVVGLAATIIWEWNQRRGDRLVLAIPGPRAEVFDGLTGPEHARRLLESLALLSSVGTCSAPGELQAHIPATAAIIVVAICNSDLPAELDRMLSRPVTLLTPEQLYQGGIYTPP
jgi:uncharacterized protein (DUF58 family)